MDSKFTYQCFFVDRWNWLREGFIHTNASVLGTVEKGAEIEKPALGTEQKVYLEGVPRGSSDEVIMEAVKKAALSATDFSWLAHGETVLIKPANNSGSPYPATTNPAGIKAMVKLLKEKGAGRVIVSDMAGIEHVRLTPDTVCGSTRMLMARNGILEAAQSAGAEVYLPEEHGWDDFFEDGPAHGSHWRNGIMVPKILKEVDHIVLMPRVSRHPLAGVTLGLKSAVGYIRFDSRLEYHRDAKSYYEKHTEINSVPAIENKLRLVLSTATKIQTTFGPDNGFVSEPETGLIIASESIVAHDMAAMAWLMENREVTPEREKAGFRDPYGTNSRVVSVLNGGVVFLLGGFRESFKTDPIKKYNLESIWNDPTLHRAFEIWGAPRLELKNQTGSAPRNIVEGLVKRVTS
jgi:uncharacterized protein (DUF362 family)